MCTITSFSSAFPPLVIPAILQQNRKFALTESKTPTLKYLTAVLNTASATGREK